MYNGNVLWLTALSRYIWLVVFFLFLLLLTSSINIEKFLSSKTTPRPGYTIKIVKNVYFFISFPCKWNFFFFSKIVAVVVIADIVFIVKTLIIYCVVAVLWLTCKSLKCLKKIYTHTHHNGRDMAYVKKSVCCWVLGSHQTNASEIKKAEMRNII